MMDIRQLRYFVAIVEHGSFSRAAEFLRVAQPALSLHVRNMETDLGTALLFRSPRGVQATESGAILLRHARTILDQLAVAQDEIRGHENDPAGVVRLGLPGTIGQILAVPLITALHQRHPRIKLRIAEAMSGFVLEWLRDGRIDLAVLYGASDDNGIRTRRLLDEELLFVGPAPGLRAEDLPALQAPLPFVRIVDMPLILPGAGHGLRDLLDRCAGLVGARLNPAFEVDSYGNIKSLVAEGLGYSVLPRNAIADEVSAGRLQDWRICDPAIRRGVHLAHSVERPITNAASVVLRIVGETVRDLARTGRWVGTAAVPDGDETP